MITHIYVYNNKPYSNCKVNSMIISKIYYELIMVIFVICMVIIICVSCIHISYCILNNVLIKYIVIISMGITLFAL